VQQQNPSIKPIGWREKFAATLVLLIGIIVLMMQVFALISSKDDTISEANGAFIVKKGDLFTHIRTWLTILVALTGGMLLLKGKKLGWMLGMALLLFFTVLALYGVALLTVKKSFTGEFKVVSALAALLLIAIVFLGLPSARSKYRVGPKTWWPTLFIFMAIAAVYFFLQ
jgi:hypothetical protein